MALTLAKGKRAVTSQVNNKDGARKKQKPRPAADKSPSDAAAGRRDRARRPACAFDMPIEPAAPRRPTPRRGATSPLVQPVPRMTANALQGPALRRGNQEAAARRSRRTTGPAAPLPWAAAALEVPLLVGRGRPHLSVQVGREARRAPCTYVGPVALVWLRENASRDGAAARGTVRRRPSVSESARGVGGVVPVRLSRRPRIRREGRGAAAQRGRQRGSARGPGYTATGPEA